jgi:hypothetical protein
MASERPAVSVIIATLGLRERADLLEGAITSVAEQVDVRAIPLVVLNGTRACPDVERRLRADRRVRLVMLGEADLPTALRVGRAAVDTPYFGALDDDDVLLPGAIARRVGEFSRRRDLDVVVTNGFRREDGVDELNIPADTDINSDPIRSLLQRNWLLPGSWLCRTDRVGVELFEGMPSYLECTYLAASFATGYTMRWLGEPTVAYRIGSPLAESRSRRYVVGQAAALRRILRLPLPVDVQRALRRRIATAYHSAAEYDRRAGDMQEAWRWHLASLRSTGGWRYLPFTRHLLRPLSWSLL